MRNLKKYLSVLLVVAMLASAMVPAFAAETYTYSAEAQKLNTLGLYSGISATTFDPDLGTALDRETGVVMLLRIFGLEATAKSMSDADAAAALAAYTDAKDVSEWALKSVAYAVKNGLVAGTSATTIGPKVALSGDMYATLVLRQLGYTVGTNDYSNATYILADKGGLKITEAIKFDNKDLIKDDLVGITFGTLNVKYTDGTSVITDLIADGVVTVANAVYAGVYTAPATPTPTATPTPVPFGVESASALNNKQVQIVFNQAVDKTTAETVSNYKRAGTALVVGTDYAKLQDDGKTVIITLGAPEAKQAKISYTVTTSVKDAAKVALAAAVSKDVTFVDTTVPTAVKAEQYGPKAIKVTFNEPVKVTAGTSFKVDGGMYSYTTPIAAADIDAQNYTIIVRFGTTLPVGDHKIIVNPTIGGIASSSIQDFSDGTPAGATAYAVPETELTVTMSTDTVAASIVSAVATSRKAVEITFDKELDSTSLPAAGDITFAGTYVSGPAAPAIKAGSNGKVLVVDFTTNVLPAGSATISIAKDKVKTLYGVKSAALSTSVEVADDTTAPTATITVVNDKKIKLVWSEAVTNTTPTTNYILKDSAGTAIVSKAYSNSTGNPIATITYASKETVIDFGTNSLPAGSYLLNVTGAKDGAVVPNSVVATDIAFSITDTTAPTVTVTADLIPATATVGQKIVVKFSESMDASILNSAMYLLNSAALPSGTTITAGPDNKSAIITLPTTTTITAAATVVVGQVSDAVGNKTVALSTTVGMAASANVGVVAGSLKATSTTTIQFKTNYTLAGITAADFTIGGTAATSASYVNGSNDATVTLTYATAWATNASPVVTVGAGGGIVDTIGRTLAAVAWAGAADAMAPAVANVNIGGTNYPNIVATDAVGANHLIDTITITYTENIFPASISINTYEVEGYTVVNAVTAAGALASDVVVLTVTEKSTIDTSAKPKVKQLLPIKDVVAGAGTNAKAADSDYVASLDGTVPYITSVTVKSVAGGTSNDTITIVFSEPMKSTTATAKANITAFTTGAPAVDRTGLIPLTGVLSEDGKTLTFTLTGDLTVGDAFSITGGITFTDAATMLNAMVAQTVTGTVE